MSQSALQRLHNLDDNFLLTRAEASQITGKSPGVLCNHSYAGLLPFIPGRPARVRVGDLKFYIKHLMTNGARGSLHPSMRVHPEDRQAYSPLHGVSEFTRESPKVMISKVLTETSMLWAKYKDARDAEKLKRQRRARSRKGK